MEKSQKIKRVDLRQQLKKNEVITNLTPETEKF
jgi:hypothetical protein